MGIGEIDLVEIVFTLFWLFFAGLIIYIRREDKREGYPLESDRTDLSGGRVSVVGFPAPPPPKQFKTPHHGVVTAPRPEPSNKDLAARPVAPYPGAPLEPTGNPMLDGVGPGSYSNRADVPDATMDGEPRIVPMRVAKGFVITGRDPDPRGMDVIAGDGNVAGVVSEVWVDRGESFITFLEVDLGAEHANKHVMLPIGFCRISGSKRQVKVRALYASHFADIPQLASSDQITMLEEEKIYGYYGGGTLYADVNRQEPLL